MLVHIGALINKKILGKYALPAFNTQDLETSLGIIRAAEAQKAPVILQTSVGALEYAGIEELVGLNKTLARSAKVPIALHQDHCHDFNLIKKLINLGYTSVMIDASHLPYKDNLKLTKEVVSYAHKRGVWVQAELGRILGSEDWQNVKSGEDLMTDPEEAVKFVAETRIDTLAVAVGSMHGIPVNPKIKKILSTLKEHIDLDRLKAIHQKIKIPLVLHGASGVPDPQMRAAIKLGVAIFNIDTDLRVAFNKALRTNLKDNPELYDPRKILGPATAGLQAKAEEKIKLLKCNNKAKLK
ncbi:MAG TPA: class II fructose-bisphosphate aldolase [Methylomirabilota bacterium]|jgi:fructose-bisphosphate aldolase class II|nr:class II fructose-bisphosphate aldolase [Methylomirabilota bacterium]